MGSTYAAAIGSGSDQKSVCGAVIVKPGIVSVTARKPDNAGELIGAGSDGVCHGVFLDEAILVDDHDNYRTLSSRAVNLANITEATTIADGKIITGTLVANVKVSIADGATVTLRSATINGVNNSSYSWAGITCLGDATIILEGDNNVTGFYENYPGIHIPEGHTLTIKGDGLLNASGNVRNNRRWAAGIGGGYDVNCGNIRIEGGTITAAGGSGAANIGGGMRGTCGSITITKGVTCVTATEDSNASCSIGRGRNGTVGTVTIGGVVGEITENPYTYMPNLDLTSVTADTTLASGMTVTGTLAANVKVSIADGATVTLRDVTINAGTSEWAGLTCLGDATIILEGSNSVSGYDTYPGIHVPSDYTLTIKGDGSLTARAGTHSSTDRAAGIGGGWGKSCGNIVIDGGEIDAIGGMRAAGIGGGFQGSCGDITISRRVTRVTATKGAYGVYSIGPGQSGSCGTVTIGGEEGEIAESPYTYVPTKVNLAAQSGDYTATDGDMLYGETAHTVTIPAGATVTINGVEVTGAEGGTVLPSPTFSAGGKAATTEFVRGANGKWTLTTFAEMSNDALGKDVPNNQIKVYSANTVEGLNSASPMTSGVTVKEKKSAVKATIEVTPPSGAQRQFFKVKIGE